MDWRVADYTVIIKCGCQPQKKTHVLHIFKAEQFRSRCHKVGMRNAYPQPPSRNSKWWDEHFRIRIDEKWHSGRSSCRYRFYSQTEVMDVIAAMMAN